MLNVLNILSCRLAYADVYSDNKRRRNSHELVYGKKFVNEIEDGKQTVVGNKYKPRRPHSASRISDRGSHYLNSLEDSGIKYYCQNTLKLSSLKGLSPPQPKIFCIEKSNVIVLPSLRTEVENFAEIEEIKNNKVNISKENSDINYTDETDSNKGVAFVKTTKTNNYGIVSPMVSPIVQETTTNNNQIANVDHKLPTHLSTTNDSFSNNGKAKIGKVACIITKEQTKIASLA